MRKYKKTVKVLSIIFVVLAVMVALIIGYCIHTTPHNEEEVEASVEESSSVTKTYIANDGTEYEATYDPFNRLSSIKKLDNPTKNPFSIPLVFNDTVLNKPEEPVETVEEVDSPVYQTPEYPDEQSNDEFEYLISDDFKLTHYCHCALCCGKAGQPTASGRMPELGVTVGVDSKLIKLGSYLRIEIPDGNGGYTVYRAKARADDTGGAVKGNKIDVFVGSHQEALNLGVIRNARVYLIGEQK